MREPDDGTLFEAARAEIETRMLTLAVSRFGAEATARLRPAIAELAGDAARVQLYPVDTQFRPAFYLNTED
jgi:DNA-binding FadR family transcriptional regulator